MIFFYGLEKKLNNLLIIKNFIYQNCFIITTKISSYKIASLFDAISLAAGLRRPKNKIIILSTYLITINIS